MKRKRRSGCLSKIFNVVFTGVLVLITTFCLQIYFNTPAAGASTLKFAQISDDHLSFDKINKAYRLTSNSGELLADAIDTINNTPNVDFVFFTGDIIDVPFEKNLTKFFEYANTLKVPYYAVPGNHDICVGGYLSKSLYVNLMKQNDKYFKFDKTYYSFTPKSGYKVIALDPIIDNRITSNGELPQEQLDFLDNEIKNAGNSTILIFMHVPLKQPFTSDSHKLLNDDAMYQILRKYSNPIGIFTGHYHTTRVNTDNNIVHISTPALISYPNAFRIVTVKNYKNRTVFEIQYTPTKLLELQKKSKLLVFHASTYYGDEKDRTTTITIERGKNNDR